jgi:chromosome segregation ATPase
MTAQLSPHGQLLAAFATLKKEKDALVALTALQKQDKEALIEELGAAQKSLDDERAKVEALEAQLELKAVSAECQIAEVKSFSKEALDDAHEKNSKYSEKVLDMESYIEEAKKEKQYLLQRTASLARRDQLQKATITQLTEEIDSLTEKVQDFGDQFSSLASRSAEMAEYRAKSPSESAGKWMAEKRDMAERIIALETSCDKLKNSEATLKETFIQTLSKHQGVWQTEKDDMKRQVQDLVVEKEDIEARVTEIAALLEQSHVERYGRTFSEEEEETLKEPSGVKKLEIYNQ